MTCRRCEKWAATTREQLNIRLARMADHPKVDVFACEDCHGRDWADTDLFVREDFERPPPPSLWMRLMRRLFPGPS